MYIDAHFQFYAIQSFNINTILEQKTMKILMYADGFAVKTQTFITQDIKYLAKNHEILFICTKIYNTLSIPNVTIKEIPFKHSFIQRKLWQYDIKLDYHNKHFSKKISELIHDFNPDIIHCQFGIESLKFIDNLPDVTIPLAIQFRGYDASRMLQKKSYVKRLQEILNRKDYYSIFVADSLRQNLKKHSISVEKSMILHSGIDLNRFAKQTDTARDEFVFLQVSSLNQKKGHEYTLKAFAKFLSSQNIKKYKLILTGDGERKPFLEQLTLDLNIEKYVDFVGFVSPDEAKVLLQNADVFVHHSVTPDDGDEEGIPNAVIEAMAMELPILSTYHAGIPELVEDGVNGYLVKEKDINMYATRMNDISKWSKLKINREVVVKEFEIDIHIKKLETFYLKMLAN